MSSAILTEALAHDFRATARRWLPLLALASTFVVLFAQFAALAHSASVLIRFPFGVDYGEGIVWQQMRNMLRGHAYGPLGVYPAIVYHYPPVFHLLTAATAKVTELDGLGAGRLVSWLSTLGTAVTVGLLAWCVRGPADGWLARGLMAALAALIFLGTDPVMDWSAMMRVDMLAGLFGTAGLVLAIQALRRPALVHLAALCFVLAIYTKQVSVAAPAAAFVALLATRPPLAWRLLGTALLLGLLALAGLSWVTDGGFLRHIVLYNVNRFRPDLITVLFYPCRIHLTYLVLSAAGAAQLARGLVRDWPTRARLAEPVAGTLMTLVFLALKTAMLPMVMKSGANLNYLVEWFSAVAVTAALGLAPLIGATVRRAQRHDESGASPVFVAAIFGIVAMQAADLYRRAVPPVTTVPTAAEMETLVAVIRDTPAPVIADEMTLLIRAGRDVEWEPAITAELASSGHYDQSGFIRLIRARYFGLFITEGHQGNDLFDARYNLPVVAAMDKAYPVIKELNAFTLHLPVECSAERSIRQ